jgi:hypothetical protein
VTGPELGDLLLEVLQRRERAVHAREAEIGHLVELPQRPQDRQPHLVARHLGRAGRADGVLDLLGQELQLVLGDGAALAGSSDPRDDLGAVERLADPAALDHGENRFLDGREPTAALRTGATATGGRPLIGLARVDDPAVGVVAERAAHVGPPPLRGPHPTGTDRQDCSPPVPPVVLWTLLGTSGGCPGENLRTGLWTGLHLCNY